MPPRWARIGPTRTRAHGDGRGLKDRLVRSTKSQQVVRSRRHVVQRCLHFLNTTRVHQTRSWEPFRTVSMLPRRPRPPGAIIQEFRPTFMAGVPKVWDILKEGHGGQGACRCP